MGANPNAYNRLNLKIKDRAARENCEAQMLEAIWIGPYFFMILFLYRFVRFALVQNDESRMVYTFVDKLSELLGGVLIMVWARRKRDWLVHFYWLAIVKLALYAVIILDIVPGLDANLKEMEKIGMQSNQRVGPFLYFIPTCLFQFRIGLYGIYPCIFVY